MPLVRGRYPVTNPSWTLNGAPSGLFREGALRRVDGSGNLAALTTQVLLSTAIHLEAGDVVSNLTFMSGNTAANTPTNWWFALYDDAATPALLAQTADQTTAAWAANTAKTLALSTSKLISRSGIYYAAVMVKATAVPTLVGLSVQHANVAGAIVSGQKVLAQTSGSALTDTAPATIATPTTVATVPYVVAT
jgi:hypothetical protein